MKARAISRSFLEAEGQKPDPVRWGESRQVELEADELKLIEVLLPLPFLSRATWSLALLPEQQGLEIDNVHGLLRLLRARPGFRTHSLD